MAAEQKSGGIGAWLVRVLSRFLFLVIIFVAGALAMHFGMHSDDHANMAKQQETIAAQQEQISALQDELDNAKSQSELKQGTEDSLENQVSDLQQELAEVRDQLSFYEQLVPPGPAGSVTVRAFTAEQNGDVLNYRVLLTRNAKPEADAFNGKMQLIATGILDGKEVKINLTSEALQQEKSAKNQFALQFDRFQRSAGVLTLQDGFIVKSVQLEVLEGDALKATSETALGVKNGSD